MGYRSDVTIAVTFRTQAQLDEVWAVYCLDAGVAETGVANEWRRATNTEFPTLVFEGQWVKWYETYPDVRSIEYLIDLADTFADERQFEYASLFLRIGEETCDVEESVRENDPRGELMNMLHDMLCIARRMENAIET